MPQLQSGPRLQPSPRNVVGNISALKGGPGNLNRFAIHAQIPNHDVIAISQVIGPRKLEGGTKTDNCIMGRAVEMRPLPGRSPTANRPGRCRHRQKCLADVQTPGKYVAPMYNGIIPGRNVHEAVPLVAGGEAHFCDLYQFLLSACLHTWYAELRRTITKLCRAPNRPVDPRAIFFLPNQKRTRPPKVGTWRGGQSASTNVALSDMLNPEMRVHFFALWDWQAVRERPLLVNSWSRTLTVSL